MLEGKIININKNRYSVVFDENVYYCSVRGKLRFEKTIPTVGDNVIFNKEKCVIERILNRKNYLLRPNVANVDAALIITSVKKPDLDLNLLDKLLSVIIFNKIKPIICFTKLDLLNKEELEKFNLIRNYYEKYFDVVDNTNIYEIEKLLSKKIVVLTGQTGAGKSSLINKLCPNLNLKTNEISLSLGRGVHTTRMVSLYKVNDFYVCDTPGFSSLSLDNMTKEDLKNSFLDFKYYPCKYNDCDHINTDGCNIEKNKDLLLSRYENYKSFIGEINENSSKLFSKR